MSKVKNVQPGILIIADAGLKLTPGEVAEMETLTVQVKRAIENGLLAHVEVEVKQKAKSPGKENEKTSADVKAPESNLQMDLKTNAQTAKPDTGVTNGAG